MGKKINTNAITPDRFTRTVNTDLGLKTLAGDLLALGFERVHINATIAHDPPRNPVVTYQIVTWSDGRVRTYLGSTLSQLDATIRSELEERGRPSIPFPARERRR